MTTTTDHSLDGRTQAGATNGPTEPDPEVPERARGPRRYSASYKARILEEYERLDKAAKGALLRREGLYTSLTPSGASSVTAVRCRRWPSPPVASRPIPATSSWPGCTGRTSACRPSLARPAR